MRVTVFGATGRIGGHVVAQALDGGHKVTAVVRDPTRLTLNHPSLEVVAVSGLTDPEPLVAALDGSEAAISGIGPASPRDKHVASTTVRAILAALDRAGLRRFVAVSAMPIGPVPDGDSWLNRRIQYPVVRTLLRGIYGAGDPAQRDRLDRGPAAAAGEPTGDRPVPDGRGCERASGAGDASRGRRPPHAVGAGRSFDDPAGGRGGRLTGGGALAVVGGLLLAGAPLA
jgi:NAD(P)H-binding